MTTKIQREIKDYAFVTLGSFLIAAAFVLFITPYNIVPGGVYGAGVVLNHLFESIEVGTWGLFMDVPLLITAFLIFGRMFGAKTIYAALMIPVVMNTMTHFIGSDPATMFGGQIDLSDDVLLSCLFGGVVTGLGSSLILKSRSTSGGTDIIAMMISRFVKMPIARALLIIDSSVVIFGLIVFGDWKLPLYSLVTIFVLTQVIDFVLEGGSGDKLAFILSDRHEEISKYIIDELSRGGTYIHSAGIYTQASKEMIFVVVSRREMTMLQDCVRQVDHKAFMIVVNAHETLGDGFKMFQDKVGG